MYNGSSVNVVGIENVNSKNSVPHFYGGRWMFSETSVRYDFFKKKRKWEKDREGREKEGRREGKNILAGTIIIFF